MDKRTVLIVDDTTENIDLLVELLKGRYIVKAARSGQLALKIAQSANPPDLVLLDILMPEMDGFEVCRELKRSPATASIPVILVSGEIGEEERRRGAELGVVGYQLKPVEPHTLIAAVESALQQMPGRQ